MGDQIKADYEALEQIASQFGELSQKAREVRGKILPAYEDVKSSWQGKGAKAFEEKMESDIKTSISNLETILNDVSNSIRKVAQKFHDAEEAIKSKGGSVGGGAGNRSSGTP